MKLKAAYETEIYLSNTGYFCINQDQPFDGIILTPSQAEEIIGYIKDFLDQAKESFDSFDGDGTEL